MNASKKIRLKVGDRVVCRITEVGDWGAYGVTQDDNEVFINPAEMSWKRLTSVSDIVHVDQEIEIEIVREPKHDHPIFLGSIRLARSQDDPWHEDTVYVIGAILRGTVFSVTPQFALAELTNGAIAFAEIANGTQIREGENVMIQVSAVSRERRTIEGKVID